LVAMESRFFRDVIGTGAKRTPTEPGADFLSLASRVGIGMAQNNHVNSEY